jgi:phosphoribosylformylglycinamidine synthase subunit PurS
LSEHQLEIRVKPRSGLLDPEGKAIQHALDSLDFPGVSDVRVGKVIDLRILAESPDEALEQARRMCRKLLANPVTEDFHVTLVDPALAGEPSR